MAQIIFHHGKNSYAALYNKMRKFADSFLKQFSSGQLQRNSLKIRNSRRTTTDNYKLEIKLYFQLQCLAVTSGFEARLMPIFKMRNEKEREPIYNRRHALLIN
ncbi:hypothetical protein [Bartonella apis]|uniref:hypothetical protein n=1 Tax=Bartonella apis TaxID=1686310 RepID=UPI00096A2C06|nr:hypothetical protein [Bartonella apis]